MTAIRRNPARSSSKKSRTCPSTLESTKSNQRIGAAAGMLTKNAGGQYGAKTAGVEPRSCADGIIERPIFVRF